jgi:hypothetical protein
MLRLTTNVTVSPASSTRSSSAAWRMSSIASGRVSANSAVSSSSDSGAPSRPRAIAPGTRSGRIARSSRRPDPRRGMNDQKRSLTTSSTPCSIHSESMYCGYTQSRSVRAYPRGWSCLRMRCAEGNGCSGEMWSPLADRPPRSVAPSSTRGSHQSDRLGGIWMPTSGIRRRHARTSVRMSSSVIGVAQPGGGAGSPWGRPSACERCASSAISAGSAP